MVGDEGRPVASTIALVAAALQEGLDERLLELPCVIAHHGQRLVPPAADSTRAFSTKTTPLADQLGIATLLHPAHLAPTNGAPEVLEWLREVRSPARRFRQRRNSAPPRQGGAVGTLD